MEDSAGLSYTGNHNVSESGKSCRAWWAWVASLSYEQHPNAHVIDAQNFCRNIAIFGVSSSMTQKHSCFTYADEEEDLVEYYDLPQCSDDCKL